MEFKDRLRDERSYKGLTQSELGKKFNLSKQAISSYENGVSYPSPEVLIKFANYFDVSIDYLLGRTNIRSSFQKLMITLNKTENLCMTYKEAFEDIKERLINANLIGNNEEIPIDIVRLLIKYGEDATFEILKSRGDR